MKRLLLILCMVPGILTLAAAQTKSPDEFLGYPLGSRFSSHEQVTDYFRYIASKEKNVRLVSYGRSYEGRELMVAIVSSPENMVNLERIRVSNLALSKAEKPGVGPGEQPAVLWLSYNVHGNEASSSETAMRMLYALTGGSNAAVAGWLKNTVVIIDPCLNPDGRERYVHYFRSVSDRSPNVSPMSREHHEPWPGGRTNHYYFDLNRDWAWQTQLETVQRLRLYRQWMPEVHVDFHEQNYNEPYYFAPAAEPIHVDITPWQREFQVIAGKNNARYFDEKGWQYFTRERFDLLYPSYGDTYPLYNGAVGMTYEQGGIGAGLAVLTLDGDTLTLKDRIEHHFVTGMATLETVSRYADRLVEEFRQYFQQSLASPPGIYRSYVVKAQSLDKISRLAVLLERNGIAFAFGGDRSVRGFNYESKRTEGFKIGRNDLVINLQQPAAVLANVLFEPQTEVSDSNTYDITAWSLPYVYGLKTYAVREPVQGRYPGLEEMPAPAMTVDRPYAWIFDWDGIRDARLLLALQRAGIKVRAAQEGFTIGTKVFSLGTLLVYRAENERLVKGLADRIGQIVKELDVACYPVAGGSVDQGKDLGSSVYPVVPLPKIGVVSGTGTSSQGVGEVWHFFEQELGHPVTMLTVRELENLDFNKINTLIIPDGSYGEELPELLENWVGRGGKLILFENAVAAFSGRKPYGVKIKDAAKNDLMLTLKYGQRNQEDLSNAIPGAIFKVDLDRSHPMSAGLGDFFYVLKTDDQVYEPLNQDWNVGVLKADSYVSGVAGKTVMKRLNNGMLFGVQRLGRGSVVYLGSDILFRSFWENGKRLFLNAVFLGN